MNRYYPDRRTEKEKKSFLKTEQNFTDLQNKINVTYYNWTQSGRVEKE